MRNGIALVSYDFTIDNYVFDYRLFEIDVVSGERKELDLQGYEFFSFEPFYDGRAVFIGNKEPDGPKDIILVGDDLKVLTTIDKEGIVQSNAYVMDTYRNGIVYNKEYFNIGDGHEIIRVDLDGTESVVAAFYNDPDNRGIPKIPEEYMVFFDDYTFLLCARKGIYEKVDYQFNSLGIAQWEVKSEDKEYLYFKFENDMFYVFWKDEINGLIEIQLINFS